MEPLPDLKSLSDDDLKQLIRELEREEDELSFRRRLLHGRIDILRTERDARLKSAIDAGEAPHVEVDQLARILAGKAPPPDEREGA